MAHVFYDIFSILNFLFMQWKFLSWSPFTKVRLILVYYCLKTEVHISTPFKILLYAFLFIFMHKNYNHILFRLGSVFMQIMEFNFY